MLPSARAVTKSRNSSAILLCKAKKPSRQALCAKAHASQVFPIPCGTDHEGQHSHSFY